MFPARKLIYVGIAAAFSISPLAFANGGVPTWEGTVKCEGINIDGTKFKPAPFAVTVEGTFPGFPLVMGRWGPGRDVYYDATPYGAGPKGATLGISTHWDGAEGGAYIETGQLKLTVDKNGKEKIEGDSIMYSLGSSPVGADISADCEWKLKPAPALPPP